MIKRFLYLLAFVLAGSTMFAQTEANLFTGKIKYNVTYLQTIPNIIGGQELPKDLEMIIKGNKAYIKTNLPDGTTAFLIDGDEFVIYRFYQIEKSKVYTRETLRDFSVQAAPTLVKQTETKVIADQLCNTISVYQPGAKGYQDNIEVYYSPELGENNLYFNTPLMTNKGIYLDFVYNFSDIAVQLEATEVTKAKRVKAKYFKMPKKFVEVDKEELRRLQSAMYRKLMSK